MCLKFDGVIMDIESVLGALSQCFSATAVSGRGQDTREGRFELPDEAILIEDALTAPP